MKKKVGKLWKNSFKIQTCQVGKKKSCRVYKKDLHPWSIGTWMLEH